MSVMAPQITGRPTAIIIQKDSIENINITVTS